MSKIFVANWKMQLDYSASLALARDYKKIFKGTSREIIVCPDFLALSKISELFKTTKLRLGAQDCSISESGAYTGEVSPKHLKNLGLSYVILGHSERRQYFAETDELINKKIIAAQANRLIPILCIGETLEEKKSGKTKEVLSKQLTTAFKGVKPSLIIAYEPVWAIGTGKLAEAEEVEEIHKFIKEIARQILKKAVKVIYGGSVSLIPPAGNSGSGIKGFKKIKNLDGFLVGGGSLKTAEFYKICQL